MPGKIPGILNICGGYYGCIGATKGVCDNKLLVRRSLVEKIILDAILELLSDPQHIEHILRRVEAEVGKLYTHVPESIHLKETELTAEERRLANFGAVSTDILHFRARVLGVYGQGCSMGSL